MKVKLQISSQLTQLLFFVFGLVLPQMLWGAIATLAFVKNNELSVVTNFKTGESKVIAQNVQSYKVATGVVVYKKENSLFLTRIYDSNKTVLVADQVEDFNLSSEMITFQKNNQLFVITDWVNPVLKPVVVGQDIQDYKTP